MDASLAAEVRRLIASAQLVLADFIEEGVDVVPHVVREPEPVPKPAAVMKTEPAPAADADWSEHPDLADVRRVLGDCQRCGLAATRNQIVFGDGNPNADLLFIGEGPGQEEDLRGLPFVGRAGELLTQMIEKGLGIARGDVYICNIVKCRPPNNRTPHPDEVNACKRFLDGQISAVRPKVIVALGKRASEPARAENDSRHLRRRCSLHARCPTGAH
jgi:DNA polymerase